MKSTKWQIRKFLTFPYLASNFPQNGCKTAHLSIPFPGFKITEENSNSTICTDIDECIEGLHECQTRVESCINSQGGYYCQCKEGFEKRNSTNECVDINECERNLHNCNILPEMILGKFLDKFLGKFCLNTEGKYLCGSIRYFTISTYFIEWNTVGTPNKGMFPYLI